MVGLRKKNLGKIYNSEDVSPTQEFTRKYRNSMVENGRTLEKKYRKQGGFRAKFADIQKSSNFIHKKVGL